MGDVMRRYWLPALLSSELPEPDCATGAEVRDLYRHRGYHYQRPGDSREHGRNCGPFQENLANSDIAIVVARRLLLDAVRTVADGEDPPGIGDSYYNARAIDAILPGDADWRNALDD